MASDSVATQCFASLLLADEKLYALMATLPHSDTDDLKAYIGGIRRHIVDAMGAIQSAAYAEMAAACAAASDRNDCVRPEGQPTADGAVS